MNCFICLGKNSHTLNGYIVCLECGHELKKKSINKSTYDGSLNIALNPLKKNRFDFINNFKLKALSKILKKHYTLVDVGSSDGSFLNYVKAKLRYVYGVENHIESREFSRTLYKLDIFNDINKLNIKTNVATFWHSLEHLSSHEIETIFKKLETACNEFVIISVPNSQSLLSKIFQKHNTYFDYQNHYHQFSNKSLDLLLQNHKYHLVANLDSSIYNYFGNIQTLLNFFTFSHNYLYLRIKRKTIKNFFLKDVINILLLPIMIFFSFFFVIMNSLFFNNNKPVITKIYERKKY